MKLPSPAPFSMKICVFFATAANVFRIANGITNLAVGVPCGIDLATIHSKFGLTSKTSHRTPRIINGVDAGRLEFPWLVSFQFKKSRRHFCTGFVINKRYVLSALHCFVDDMAGYTLPLRILKARLGQYSLTQEENEDVSKNMGYIPIDFGIEKIIGHPNFQSHDNLNDIALIRLSQDIQWSAHIRPLCLPSSNVSSLHNSPNQLVTISGWGSLRPNSDRVGEISKVLQKSRVKIVDQNLCKNWLAESGLEFSPRDSHVCAGFEEGGTDACWGDSGGPLQMTTDGSGTQSFAVGIVSAGKSCALPRHPTIYTNVHYYLDWIKANIED